MSHLTATRTWLGDRSQFIHCCWHTDDQIFGSVLTSAVLHLYDELEPIFILIEEASVAHDDVLFFRLWCCIILPIRVLLSIFIFLGWYLIVEREGAPSQYCILKLKTHLLTDAVRNLSLVYQSKLLVLMVFSFFHDLVKTVVRHIVIIIGLIVRLSVPVLIISFITNKRLITTLVTHGSKSSLLIHDFVLLLLATLLLIDHLVG